jgi:glycosyltransferase involved in cell wall biosynthesis
MKVLFDTYEVAFQSPGGGEVVIEKLYKHLSAKGIKIDFFNKWTHKISDYDIIHQINTGDYNKWFYYSEINAKFILTPTRWIDSDALSTAKYHFNTQLKKILFPGLFHYSEYNAMKIPHHFLPTTDTESLKLQNYFNLPASKFTTVYNGVEEPIVIDSSNKFKEKYNLNKFALFVGNISPNKNVDLIIKACQKSEIQLVVIGGYKVQDENYYNQCRQMSDSRTIFVGRIENTDELMGHAYHEAQMLINASDFETCSLVGLEAGSYGTPVIMTETGGTKEVYKDLVEYVKPNCVESIVNAISLTKQKNGTDKRLQTYISAHYKWDKIADQVIDIYNKILSS